MVPYYSASGIHLYHGDNASLPEALAAHGLKVADVALLWGDPPYGVSERTDRKSKGRSNRSTCIDWAPVAGDDKPFEPAPWLATYRSLALWGANHYAARLPCSPTWWWWDKRDGITPNDNADGELAWTNLGGPARQFSHLWNGFMRATGGASPVHPTEKPVALARWGFQQAKLKAGDWVVSPWLGSGPEARAALDMGLNFIGFELVEKYLRACVGRLRQQNLFTLGGTA